MSDFDFEVISRPQTSFEDPMFAFEKDGFHSVENEGSSDISRFFFFFYYSINIFDNFTYICIDRPPAESVLFWSIN